MNNWTKLYQLADRINALKPWRFMYEDDIIGVRDPVTGIIGFVSVMGNLGAHYSVTVYLGEGAFGKFLELSKNDEYTVPETVLEIPQLMLSFEDRDFLEKEDLEIMKTIGINYSRKILWPMFRNYRPGMVPWFLEEKEQESMVYFLEQFLEVMVSQDTAQYKFQPGTEKFEKILIREYKKTAKKIYWTETFQRVLIPSLVELSIRIDPGVLSLAKSMKVGKDIFEVDFFLTPAPVREKKTRPYFPYTLIVVDQKSEVVIAQELMNPSNGIDEMLVKIPGQLLRFFSKGTSLPGSVHMTSLRIANILFPLLEDFGIKTKLKPRLKVIGTVKANIMGFLAGGW